MKMNEKSLIIFQKIGQAYLQQAITRVTTGPIFQVEINKLKLEEIIAEVKCMTRGELAVSEKEIKDSLIAMIMPGLKEFLE